MAAIPGYSIIPVGDMFRLFVLAWLDSTRASVTEWLSSCRNFRLTHAQGVTMCCETKNGRY